MKSLRWIICAAVLISAHVWAQTPPALQSIATLDVPRYMGTWYEIAKFPNRFQTQCVSDTTATYRALPDGTLSVVNQCRLKSGDMQTAVGVARQIGGPDSARLKVRFAPRWFFVLGFVGGVNGVIDLVEAYKGGVVRDPTRQYLWILSRTPRIDDSRYQALLKQLAARGLDISRLEKTVQR